MSESISHSDWRYIELKGYMSSVDDLPRFGIKKGWMCMNCKSMVYYTKCPTDTCYNFYMYTNYKADKFMEKRQWEILDELGITDEKESRKN